MMMMVVDVVVAVVVLLSNLSSPPTCIHQSSNDIIAIIFIITSPPELELPDSNITFSYLCVRVCVFVVLQPVSATQTHTHLEEAPEPDTART